MASLKKAYPAYSSQPGGRYNPTIPFSQNVELTEPILSRFDVLCVVKDTVDPVIDEMLAKFVVGSHLRSHPDFSAEKDEVNVATTVDAEVCKKINYYHPISYRTTSCRAESDILLLQIIPQDLLRKYIQYARERVVPKLHDMDFEKVSR
jgi:DNA replication licensing factor MCM2